MTGRVTSRDVRPCPGRRRPAGWTPHADRRAPARAAAPDPRRRRLRPRPGARRSGPCSPTSRSPTGHPSRPQLVDLLFPDAEDPAGALRWNLSELRRLLGGPETVGSGNVVQLRLPEGSVIDVDVLMAGTLARGGRAPGTGPRAPRGRGRRRQRRVHRLAARRAAAAAGARARPCCARARCARSPPGTLARPSSSRPAWSRSDRAERGRAHPPVRAFAGTGDRSRSSGSSPPRRPVPPGARRRAERRARRGRGDRAVAASGRGRRTGRGPAGAHRVRRRPP